MFTAKMLRTAAATAPLYSPSTRTGHLALTVDGNRMGKTSTLILSGENVSAQIERIGTLYGVVFGTRIVPTVATLTDILLTNDVCHMSTTGHDITLTLVVTG